MKRRFCPECGLDDVYSRYIPYYGLVAIIMGANANVTLTHTCNFCGTNWDDPLPGKPFVWWPTDQWRGPARKSTKG